MDSRKISRLIRELYSKKIKGYGRDFLQTWDKSIDELEATLLVAEILQRMYFKNVSLRVFESGLAISWFRDKSTRTRYSFKSAANLLGLDVQDLDEEKSQISHGETVRETANMISFLSEVIGIRDDIFLGEGHKFMLEVAAAVENGFDEGILPQRPSVINLQSDRDHPTQSMADLMHLAKYFGGLKKLRGKKLVMSWAYSPSYGKPLSVAQGVCGLMTRFGMDVVLAHPPGYDLIPELTAMFFDNAKKSKSKFCVSNNMDEAFNNADVVYPKSWAPYKVMQKRTKLLKEGDRKGLSRLEKQALSSNAKYKDWECTASKMKLTKGGKALYMHCLPADVTGVSCKTGEVATSVFEDYKVDTFKQAGCKPYIIAAMMFLTKFSKPSKLLRSINRRKVQRTRR